jgi:hypothetical protein
MSFSADWLALREPADHTAVNPEVRAVLTARFAKQEQITVVDLGSGAGSNLRGTYAALPQQQHWTLVDYDPKLLHAAKNTLSKWADSASVDDEKLLLIKAGKHLTVQFREADLSTGDYAAVVAKANLVTAAALFDLVSVQSIEKLAQTLVTNGQTFFTVLTYDGHASWHPSHAADAAIRDAFNAHQRTDKGFGPASGPGGTTALAKAFYARGFRVLRGTSPWVVDQRYGTLRRDLDTGFANAVRETGKLNEASIASWLALRTSSTDGTSIIGHEDLLAVPG